MDNKEFDRRMEFIVGQQAQFASDIVELKDAIAGLENIVGRLANASLTRFENVDERIAALVDSQAHTDENLKTLISVVDRYFSDRNGGSSA